MTSDEEDEDLEAGKRLLQLCCEALPVRQEGGNGAEISGPRVLQLWESAPEDKVDSQIAIYYKLLLGST